MNENQLLARAVEIAAQVHAKQEDKAGAAYILHPLRMAMRADGRGLNVQTVAALHDVLEDDDRPEDARWTADRLRADGFPETVVAAVDLLTRRPDETYEGFVGRILAAEGDPGRIARQVKLLDLEDNMNVVRLADVSDKDLDRLKRYRDAHRRLTERM